MTPYCTTKTRAFACDFLSMTRMPFSLTQTLFIILGFMHAGGTDVFRIFLAAFALGPTLIYGGIYILNDIADRKSDSQHPKKKQRAIASGRVSVNTAVVLAAVLITAGLAIATMLGSAFTLICLTAIANNLAYSYGPRLKERLYPGLLSCSLNYPLRLMAGSSIVSLTMRDTLPAFLFFLIALNGFSSYRIYDAKSMDIKMELKQEPTLAAVIRTTALASSLITITLLRENTVAALAAAAYMTVFSEVNLGIVRRGVDFFQLLRVWKTLRENPGLWYYPVMTTILGIIVVYATLKSM